MKTYWLYYAHRLVGIVRLTADATLAQVRAKALADYATFPGVNAHFPKYSPPVIQFMLANAYLEPIL